MLNRGVILGHSSSVSRLSPPLLLPLRHFLLTYANVHKITGHVFPVGGTETEKVIYLSAVFRVSFVQGQGKIFAIVWLTSHPVPKKNTKDYTTGVDY